ncbi:MAG: UvrD-helicase domain-containing protein [Deltaproteobacteria bacterium]|nr:UvrD-helicase domain-containing protein [Deltaproteobacteria bacterium]
MAEGGFNESQERVLASAVNLCVTAGAGTGKTRTLVEYVLRYLERDPAKRSVANVLALTYTDKAAGEMRERLAAGLRARLAAAAGGGLSRYWSDEIRNLSQSEIGTIHGYANSLVRRAGWALGLPSGLAPESGGEEDVLEALYDLLRDGDPDVLTILASVPFSPRGPAGASLTGWLRAVEVRVSEWGLERLLPADGAAIPDPRAALSSFRDKAGEFLARAADGRSILPNSHEKRAGLVAGLEAFAGFWERWGPPAGELSPPALAPFREAWGELKAVISGSGYRKGKASGDFRKELGEILAVLDAWEGEARLAPARAALCALSGGLRERAFRKRLSRGAIAFSDMLYLARRILRERPDVRRDEQERWKLLVVDEFQDTNRLQADTLGLVIQKQGGTADPGAPGVGEARSRPPAPFACIDWGKAPPSFLAFGDHKQSIYRFRGAEPAVMEGLERRLREAGEARGAALSLDTNYRTVGRLVGFFNAYFGAVMGESYGKQKSVREDLYEGPAAVALLIPPDAKTPAGNGGGGGKGAGEPSGIEGKGAKAGEGKGAKAGEGEGAKTVEGNAAKAAKTVEGNAAKAAKTVEGKAATVAKSGEGKAAKAAKAGVGKVGRNAEDAASAGTGEEGGKDAGEPEAGKAGAGGGKVDSTRIEARILARHLKGILSGEEGVLIGARAPDGSEAPRVPRPGDCAILLRQKTHSDAFELALREEGIPAHTVKGEDPFADPAAAGLVRFWLALAGVETDLNLAAALASPLGPVSEASLGRLCPPSAPGHGPGRTRLSSYFTGRAAFPEGLPAEDLRVLEDLRGLFLSLRDPVQRRPPGEIMELVAEERGLVPLVFRDEGQPGGAPERVRALQTVLELVKALPVTGRDLPDSPADLVEGILGAANRQGEGAPEDAGSPGGGGFPGGDPGEGEDEGGGEQLPAGGTISEGAVNILTIHRSKGLEFPVVLIPEAHRQERDRSPSIVMSDEGKIDLKLATEGGPEELKGAGYGRIAEAENLEARHEHMRVFYVAATRARDHLVILGKAASENVLDKIRARWTARGDGPQGGDSGGAAPTARVDGSQRGDFDKAAWLHQLSSWPDPGGHVAFREAGPGEFPDIWLDEARPAAGGDGGGRRAAVAAEAVARAGQAPPAGGGRGAGLPRAAMIAPLPPPAAWTGTVTRYALMASGKGPGPAVPRPAPPVRGGREPEEPWEDGYDPVSPEADRRLKREPLAGERVPAFPGGLAPAKQGIIVHAALERTDFARDLERYREMAREEAARLGEEVSPEGLEILAGRALRFQESPLGREAREAVEAGRLNWREWPFWLRLDGDGRGRGPLTLTGAVDLFFLNAAGEGVIVDYKLSRPADETAYRIQIDIYARAVRKAGFSGAVRTELCYLAENG